MRLHRDWFLGRKHRLVVIAAILGGLSVAMLASGCDDSSERKTTAALASSAVTAPNTITVIGKATVTSAPDEAVIRLTVESDGADPAAAMNVNSTSVAEVMERLKAEGIESTAIETANVSVFPNRQYNPQTGEENLIGYRAQNTITVTLKDAAVIGKVLAAAVEAGVNNFSGPVWGLRDDGAAVAEALAQAVADARTKAEALATAQEVKVGGVIMMNEGSVEMPSAQVYYESYDLGAGASKVMPAPISPATLDVTASVTVTYGLDR
ncbi:MAG: SIMPL domain-containing protein [Actinobacteria bacterium]|nr:SIMPL domain-containing protein [Actinomycetota bacterium]